MDTQPLSVGSLPSESPGTSLLSGATTQCSTGGTSSSLTKSHTDNSSVSTDAPPDRGLLESRSLHYLSSDSLSKSVPFPDQIPGPSTVEMTDQRASSSSDDPSMQARLDSSNVFLRISC